MRAGQIQANNEDLAMPATHSERPRLTALSAEEVAQALQALPDWRLVAVGSSLAGAPAQQALRRSLRFASFPEAIAFLQTLVEPLEALNHHPRIENNWRELTVTFTTWDAGQRLTALDVQAALALERLYRSTLSHQS
jgi:4a-hydroxytetrahydrobiopterin dehydratase